MVFQGLKTTINGIM